MSKCSLRYTWFDILREYLGLNRNAMNAVTPEVLMRDEPDLISHEVKFQFTVFAMSFSHSEVVVQIKIGEKRAMVSDRY